jgi:2-polyprenyl-6-hydroxyphenyl methylase/3-demethylubiquinone-9 3-methyltransferase
MTREHYTWTHAANTHAHAYLMPAVTRLIARENPARIFDLACGNGSVCANLRALGYDVTGVDPSVEGIGRARNAHPDLNVHVGSAYDPLASLYGRFPLVVSLEVVEHVYAPRDYARTLFDLVEPGGMAVVSTPYHGYWKNLALAVTGRMDAHFTALWDHGHIKFWSMKTLGALLAEAGFGAPEWHRVGRVPPLAAAMIAAVRKPA